MIKLPSHENCTPEFSFFSVRSVVKNRFLVLRLLLLPLVMLISATLACNLPTSEKPDARATLNAALTEANVLPASTMQPASANTQTPDTAGENNSPTTAPTVPLPTAAPLKEDSFSTDLQNRGYTLIAASSTIGPKDYIYSAYLFSNTELDPSAAICRLAFTRYEPNNNELLRYFTAPSYPAGSGYTFPVSCEAVNWDAPPEHLIGETELSPETRTMLGFNGQWSDINQNGLPEFAVAYQYCAQDCPEYGEVALHFFELKNTYKIVDITATLPGIVQPWHMFHSGNPLHIWVYDPTEYESGIAIQSTYIFAWGSSEFKNVTPQRANEYSAQIDQVVEEIEADYGMALTQTRVDFIQILMLGNKAELPQPQTLTTFLDVSDPAHWPGTNLTLSCWLELARANAQRDTQNNQPFSLPPNPTGIDSPALPDILAEFDLEKFDLHSCTQLVNE